MAIIKIRTPLLLSACGHPDPSACGHPDPSACGHPDPSACEHPDSFAKYTSSYNYRGGAPRSCGLGMAEPPMPDLSHLSAEERQIIEEVFQRQRAEEEKETQLSQ
uniref:AXIN2 n=1 Tax=Ascaris lumbricoides TaxID=6252 RepID=A0A0M3IDE7_ASCLU